MSAIREEQDQRSSAWISAETGHIFYRRPQTPTERRESAVRFPAPPIRSRRSRPHAIHIVTYPSGYVPRELRPDYEKKRALKAQAEAKKRRKAAKKSERRQNSRPSSSGSDDQEQQQRLWLRQRAAKNQNLSPQQQQYLSIRPVLEKIFGSFAGNTQRVYEVEESPLINRPSSNSSTTGVEAITAQGCDCLDNCIRTQSQNSTSNNSESDGTGPSTPTSASAPVSTTASEAQREEDLNGLTGIQPPSVPTSTPAAYDVIQCQHQHQHQHSPLHNLHHPTPSLTLQYQSQNQDAPGIDRCQRPYTASTPSPSSTSCPTASTIPTGAVQSQQLHHHYHSLSHRRSEQTLPSHLHQHEQNSGNPESCPNEHLDLVGDCRTSSLNNTNNNPIPSTSYSSQQEPPSYFCHHYHQHPPRRHDDGFVDTVSSTMTMAAGRITAPASAYNLSTSQSYNRSSIMPLRSAKSAVSSIVTEVPKPVASGSGVTCSILLAEPNVFLSGFDHDGNGRRDGGTGTALLRGKLQLNVSKNVKIKAVQLKLLGRARTEWPEGIPPLKQDLFEQESLRTQVLTFFNAMNEGWETEYGNQCTYKLKSGSANSSTTSLVRPGIHSSHRDSSASSKSNLSAKELKRLSLQNVQSRSFNKDSPIATATQAKGFKVFYPGTYDYSFELPIDHHQLETIKLQYGSVKWELHATVDRAGAFKPNLHGVKEVPIIRVPDQLSLEMTEPISISRQWEDQLHYDIIISGKSFPIGGKIPVAFKLTPLAKVQVHKLKVFVTESVEYWTNDKRVTRKDPGRKILLLEKSAGKPLDPVWASSELRTVRGGELTPEQRREAREIAARRRSAEASRNHTEPVALPQPTDNILGDLELGLESYWGSTEIEANVQIPTCEMMAKNKDLRLHPDCSWKNVNVYHWIKIVMRISRIDPEDPTGTKRRHFEISIDSPFTILNCRATQANTNLPAYSGPISDFSPCQSACGCPDAATINKGSPNSSTGTLPGVDMSNEALPAMPQAAHLHATSMNPASNTQGPPATDAMGINGEPRPIHLLRVPSYNPPAFEDDTAPPPAPEFFTETPPEMRGAVFTPPPQYDVVVGTPSVDGLADYFARLADYGYDEDHDSSDSDDGPPRILERSGRVNVAHPRTPGGRMPSRSLEISRPPISLNMSSLPRRTPAGQASS